MNIQFKYEENEKEDKRPFQIADALRRSLAYDDYIKVIALCQADIESDKRLLGVSK